MSLRRSSPATSQAVQRRRVHRRIALKDEMLLLEETQINNTFLDTTPQEMISYFLGRPGSQR